jgi:hypothetical protein
MMQITSSRFCQGDWHARADRLKCRHALRAASAHALPAQLNVPRSFVMWVIALEALVALALLLLIVWLTMGSSRRREEEAPPKQLEHDRDREDKG